MARIETDPNYTSPTFSRATAATDPFKKEDVQSLAAAFSTHTHDAAGKGLGVVPAAGSINGSVLVDSSVPSTKLQPPIDMPGLIRTTSNFGQGSGSLATGLGMEMYFDGTESVIQSYNRTAPGYLPLFLIGSPVRIRSGGADAIVIDTAANVTVSAGQLNVPNGPIRTGQFLQTDTGILYLGTDALAFIQRTGVGDLTYRSGGTGSSWFTRTDGTYADVFTGHIHIEAGKNLIFSGAGGSIGNVANITLTGTGSISTTTGHLYLRSASGQVIFDAGPVGITNGALTVSGNVTCNSVVASGSIGWPQGIYLTAAGGGPTIAYRTVSPQAHSFEFTTGGYAPIYASAFTPASARKFKDSIAPLQGSIDLVLNDMLYGVRYTEAASGLEKIGFVADDWYLVEPSLVGLLEGDVETLDYDRIGAITFQALKEYIQKTDARLAALEAA